MNYHINEPREKCVSDKNTLIDFPTMKALLSGSPSCYALISMFISRPCFPQFLPNQGLSMAWIQSQAHSWDAC